jgi:hypothetical protein
MHSKKRLIISGPLIVHTGSGSETKQFSRQSIFLMSISSLIYLKKHTKSKIRIVIMKWLALILWLNIGLVNKSRKFIPEMLRV